MLGVGVLSAAPHDSSLLFAVLDLARAPHLYQLITLHEPFDAQCLFSSNISEDLRQASPFLVNSARVPSLMEKWRAEGTACAWGLLIVSSLSLDRLRRKLKTIQQVRLPDNVGPVLFRFWDPRVMRPFLQSAEPAQCESLFDGIDALLIEDEGKLQRYTWDNNQLHVRPTDWP